MLHPDDLVPQRRRPHRWLSAIAEQVRQAQEEEADQVARARQRPRSRRPGQEFDLRGPERFDLRDPGPGRRMPRVDPMTGGTPRQETDVMALLELARRQRRPARSIPRQLF